jgi:ribosomal 50S subunit-recycling heat shock protein
VTLESETRVTHIRIDVFLWLSAFRRRALEEEHFDQAHCLQVLMNDMMDQLPASQ